MRSTWCEVIIETPDLEVAGGPPPQRFMWSQGGDLDGLKSISVTTTVDKLGSRFQLKFAPEFIQGLSWARQIPAYSLTRIRMGSTGEDGDDATVLTGLTWFGSETATWGEQPKRTVILPGVGIEAAMADHGVWHAPYFDQRPEEVVGILENVISGPLRERLSGRVAWSKALWAEDDDPRDAILRVLAYYLVDSDTTVVDLRLPNGSQVQDLLFPIGMVPADLADWEPPQYDKDTGEKIRDGKPINHPDEWTLVDDRLRIIAAAFTPAAGTISQLVGSLLDPMFHEFFVSHIGGQARIIHRVRPYLHQAGPSPAPHGFRPSTSPNLPSTPHVTPTSFVPKSDTRPVLPANGTRFNLEEPTLISVYITDNDVKAHGLTFGTTIRNAFYSEPAQGSLGPQLNVNIRAQLAPAFAGRNTDASFIGRFGIRPIEHRCPYLAIGAGEEINEAVAIGWRLSRILRDWYEPEPLMAHGSISLVGRAEFRPGSRMVWNSREYGLWEFYIHAVTQTYSFQGGSWTTRVSVRRGWYLGAGGRVGLRPVG